MGIPPNISRRQLLHRCGMGMGALTLSTLLQDLSTDNLARASSAITNSATPLAARTAPFFPKAKRVVHFFLNGGPSHVDTFDPKPALAKYAGRPLDDTLRTERKTGAAFPSPFKFQKYGESGIEVSELFAETARHVDEIAVIRSMK